MTECERIIQQGILPREFFVPETKDGFYVSELRKKILAVELDLLLEFDRVCRNHGLKYFLIAGTLLGAIRHKGFIPWDDDIDVGMLREDYDEFMKLSDEFKHPYFLQTPYTDSEYFFSFAKLRNSNTSALNKMFLFQNGNKGIVIDVFPYDKVSPEDFEEDYSKNRELFRLNSTSMMLSNPYLQDTPRIKEYPGGDPIARYEEAERTAKKYQHKDTGYISGMMCTIYDISKKLFHDEDFSSLCDVEFEGFTFPTIAGYDRVLRTIYGDYMQFPPVEERGKWHKGVLINPDIPYKDLLPKYQSAAWPENIPMP